MPFKQALFEDDGREVEQVEGMPDEVYVRTLTVAEKDAFATAVEKEGNLRARLLIATCCDQNGEPIFDEFDVGRINKLASWKIEPIIDAAIKLNRMGPKDADAIRKNSATIPSANST